MIGAQLPQFVQFPFRAASDDDLRARRLGQLHATGAHAARRAQDQHRIGGADLAPCQHHAVGGTIGDGQRGGIIVADPVGRADQMSGGDARVFGCGAQAGFPGHALARYEGMRADPVADGPAFHITAQFHNLAGEIATRDHGKGRGQTRGAAQDHGIEPVERDRIDLDDNIRRTTFGIGEVANGNFVHAAVFGKDRRSHNQLLNVLDFPIAAGNKCRPLAGSPTIVPAWGHHQGSCPMPGLQYAPLRRKSRHDRLP